MNIDINDIIEAIHTNRLRISDHADEEAEADRLSFDEIFFAVLHGEIIEDYPTDRPYPSCLIYGQTFSGDPIHSVWAYNAQNHWAGPDYGVSAGPESMDRVAGKEKMTQMPFVQCPVCGGEMVEKDVEKLLRGGMHMAVVAVRAEVCLRCGERLYSQDTVRYFANIRTKLKRQETADFQPLGQAFSVPAHSR